MKNLTPSLSNFQIGLSCAAGAQIIWGLMPIYWAALSGYDSVGVVCQRYWWTTLLLLGLLVLQNRTGLLKEAIEGLKRNGKNLVIFAAAASMGALNWWISAVAPMTGHTVELSIGNFITPLLSVATGIVFFGDRVNRLQTIGLGLALIGVALMVVNFGDFPWVALGVSGSWAAYSALKKRLLISPLPAIVLESVFILPLATAYLFWTADVTNSALPPASDLKDWMLFAGSGLIIGASLVAYNFGTNFLNLTYLGLTQYLTPLLALLLGVFVFKESFEVAQQTTLIFIWCGIAVFIYGGVQHKSRLPRFDVLKKTHLFTHPRRNTMKQINEKVTWGNYVALISAIIFFSGILTTKTEWWGIFDFMTVKGAFGMVVAKVQNAAGGITTTMSNFQGKGGSGATDGFVFALTLTPVVIFAIAMVSIFEHYGALKAARRLLTPILRPVLGIPGACGLALIGSLQSVDSGAAFTKALYEQKEINDEELNTFAAMQMCSGATITNLFGSGAALWALSDGAGGHAIACSIGVTLGVILVFKVIAANIVRLIQKSAAKKATEQQGLNLNTAQA